MKRYCAWCRLDMGRKEPLDDPRVTHGICQACGEGMVRAAKRQPGDRGEARRTEQASARELVGVA
jgi:hypothetical protein